MEVILQLAGASLYTLNKWCFSFAERAKIKENRARERRLRISAWVLCITGLPAFLVLFCWRHNWIAASVEASGVPAMVMGIAVAMRGKEWRAPCWMDWFVKLTIGLGFAISFWDFGGITNPRQVLETSMVVGYLIGTYQVAHQRRVGYLWYLLMHASMSALSGVQGWWWLVAQQIVSLGFALDAYEVAGRKK